MKNPQTAWFHLVHINFVSGSSFPHSVQWDALVALKKTKLLFHLMASGLPSRGSHFHPSSKSTFQGDSPVVGTF